MTNLSCYKAINPWHQKWYVLMMSSIHQFKRLWYLTCTLHVLSFLCFAKCLFHSFDTTTGVECKHLPHWIILIHLVIHPRRLTWNIIMEVWKIIFLSKWVICRFHVNLPGCNFGWPFVKPKDIVSWSSHHSSTRDVERCRGTTDDFRWSKLRGADVDGTVVPPSVLPMIPYKGWDQNTKL